MTTVVVGGTGTLGLAVARSRAKAGSRVVITGRDLAATSKVAEEIGEGVGGGVEALALDLAAPHGIADQLATVGPVDALVITAIEQGTMSLDNFDIDKASRVVAMKLVGYTEVIRVLRDRFTPTASVVLFGGLAKDRPYPGSTIVTAFNGGIATLVTTLALELAPHRVNVIHPGVVGDTPRWRDAGHPHESRTPIGRLVTSDEIADAVEFLLRNTGINAQNLHVDGGITAT